MGWNSHHVHAVELVWIPPHQHVFPLLQETSSTASTSIHNILHTVCQGGISRGRNGGHVLVTELQGMTLNGLFCADVLRPLDLVPLTDFTYKYHSGVCGRI